MTNITKLLTQPGLNGWCTGGSILNKNSPNPALHLGFDARMFGVEHAGIGRYVENLVSGIIHTGGLRQLTLFLTPTHAKTLSVPAWVDKVPVSIRHYTLNEQWAFLHLINRYQLDLMHFPHFNVPLFYHRPFVVTIHDILWHQVRGAAVTTLSPVKYYLKYLGYRAVVNHAVGAARAVIVPSNFIKATLLRTYPHLPDKRVQVIYEGVTSLPSLNVEIKPAADPYLIYVGSAYPHKNLPVLFQALKVLHESGQTLKLMVVGSRSVFLTKLKTQIISMGLEDQVIFMGYRDDQELHTLLSRALALVHPSKSEGFGLTGLEAMSLGCPVIAARAASLPEIYGDAALYFPPDDVKALVDEIRKLLTNPRLREVQMVKGRVQAAKFSWNTTVTATLKLYRQSLTSETVNL